MGFLKKVVKKVKKGVKKLVSGVKKVVKKISKSKLLKTIAIVGAALVTGGAALGAFPGLAAGTNPIVQGIIGAGNWISSLPVVGKLAVPFSKAGAFAGEALYTAGANLGFIKEADVAAKTLQAAGMDATAIQGLSSAEKISQANAYIQGTQVSQLGNVATLSSEEIAKLGTSEILKGTTAQAATFAGPAGATAPLSGFGEAAAQMTGRAVGTVGSAIGSAVGSAVTSVAGGYLASKVMGEPDPQGVYGSGSPEEQALNRYNDVEANYQNLGIDIRDAYRNMTYGTGDLGMANVGDLYRQPTVTITG